MKLHFHSTATAIMLLILILAGCSQIKPPVRGVYEDNLNVYYSSHNPAVKITFADHFLYEREINSNHIYTGPDNSYIAVYYHSNPHRYADYVDYYYPVDRVLYENIANNGGMPDEFGKTKISGRQIYYCYSIDPDTDRFELRKNMVILSQDHDWLIIVFAQRHSYNNFRDDYHSAKDYFTENPGILTAFDDSVDSAIVKIEKYIP